MRANKNDLNVNFGWSAKTHKAITQAAAEKINKASTHKGGKIIFNTKLLTESSILPDKAPHPMGSHSADVTKLRDGDAFAVFQQYDKNIRAMIKSKNSEGLSDNIGQALHYLQDMQNPMHVNFNDKPSDAEMLFYLQFENDAIKIQHEMINYAKGIQIAKPIKFDDFLNLKMKDSKLMANHIARNLTKVKDRLAIDQQSLINSYQVTYKYLSDLAALIK